jgi:hypothetical protein
MSYQLHIYIPYEGTIVDHYETLKEIKEYLQRSGYNPFDVEVYEVLREVDLDEVMKGG